MDPMDPPWIRHWDVINMLDHGGSSTAIATKYGIVKSIVSDIKQNKAKIHAFKCEMT